MLQQSPVSSYCSRRREVSGRVCISWNVLVNFFQYYSGMICAIVSFYCPSEIGLSRNSTDAIDIT